MKRLLLLLGAAGCALFLAAPAASATTGNARHDPIIGNVAGSWIPDRTTLGYDASGCTASVERGLGHGRYAKAVVHHYTIAGLPSFAQCPDLGVAVHRRWTARDDLAVTWFSQPPGITEPLVVLRNFVPLSASAGNGYPSYVGTQDFNGDGRGDIWESTDQDASFTTYLRDGSGFSQGPAMFFNDTPQPSLAFGRLDNKRGTDIAAGYLSSHRDQPGLPGSAGSGALVASGSTGAMVLLENDPTGHTVYTVAVLDANHDGHLDVQVSGGTQAPRIYLGDGKGHFALGV